MAKFKPAFLFMMKHEVYPGAVHKALNGQEDQIPLQHIYTHDPRDRGGETKWGISSRAHAKDVRNEFGKEIKDLTFDDAAYFYETRYWDVTHFRELDSQAIASKLFDASVNLGRLFAGQLMQSSVNLVRDIDKDIHVLKVDGLIGPASARAINAQSPELLLNVFINLWGRRYLTLVGANPDQRVFLKGWFRRVMDLEGMTSHVGGT